MNFLIIANSGTWYTISAFSQNEWSINPPSPYDRYMYYYQSGWPTGVAQAGCQNPSGDSTVYANCRNASGL